MRKQNPRKKTKSSLELDGLEAGFHFMPWSFSLQEQGTGTLYSGSWMLEVKLRKTLEKLRVDAEEALAKKDEVKPEDIKALIPSRKAKAAAWFDVGWMAMFVCNMAGTGAPKNLLDASLEGFKATLQELRPAEMGQVDRIVQRIKLLSKEAVAKEERLFGIMGSLRGLADPDAPRAFLSHRSKDKDIIEPVAFALEELQVRVWYDSWNIILGDSVPGMIREGLQSADFVVFFASRQSLDPARTWIREELDKADAYRHKGQLRALLIVLLDDCDLESIYPHLHYIDARNEKNPNVIASNLHSAMMQHMVRNSAARRLTSRSS